MMKPTPFMRQLQKPQAPTRFQQAGPQPQQTQIPPEWQVQPQAPTLPQRPPAQFFLPQGPGADMTVQAPQQQIPMQAPPQGTSQFDALRQRYEGATNMGNFEIDPFNPEEILQYRRRF